MKGVTDWLGKALEWAQPSFFRNEHELRADGDVVATLRFPSSWKNMAIAESAAGRWTFDRLGFWRQRAVVRAEDGAELASMKFDSWRNKGVLELPDGREFVIRATNFWQTRYEVQAEDGTALMRLHCGAGFRHTAQMELLPAASGLPELEWLVLFAWYVRLLQYQDAAVVAVAAMTVFIAAGRVVS